MSIVNDPVPDPNDDTVLIWDRDATLGINGRGVKRPGRDITGREGSKNVSTTVGEDVTNQVSAADEK